MNSKIHILKYIKALGNFAYVCDLRYAVYYSMKKPAGIVSRSLSLITNTDKTPFFWVLKHRLAGKFLRQTKE